MALPKSLPKALTTRFRAPLMRAILIYSEHSDVIISRFLRRAAERELARLSKTDLKLKTKLEKAMKNGKSISND